MSEVETLQRRLERERQARKQAEKLAEEKTLELFQANQSLRLLNEHLEEAVQEATRELQDALRSLSTIMANLVDGLLVTDTAGNITHFNPALLAMFGLGGTDLTGRACQAFFSDQIATLIAQTQQHSTEVCMAELALAQGRIGKAVATAILKSAERTKNASAPAHTENDSLGAVVLIRDITEEKAIDQMKTDFISMVSHELRTPLTSVLGFAKIIQKRLDEDILPNLDSRDRRTERAARQVRNNTNIIVSEGERLTSLINDVLDIAKMEAGKIEWNMQPLALLQDVLEPVLAATLGLFEDKDVRLVREVAADLPEIIGDRDRLVQVVINLLSNAVKFTDRGSVTCRARRINGDVEISVIDTGLGIAEADKPQVFEKFKQVGDTLTDKPKGTGLGLPICKQIVEYHGGQIWVESVLGQGSTFTFTLPTRAASPSDTAEAWVKSINIDILVKQLEAHGVTPTPAPAAQRRKTVLVVDDEPRIRELLRQELEDKGYLVREAKDGLEAIHLAKQDRPDLITLDVMMPQINGFDVVAVLKNDPQTTDIPIIILSIIEDKARGYRLGVDRYLTKPVNVEALLQEVESLLAQGTSKKKVLVVDHDASALKTLVEVLQAQGYQVTEAASGTELLEKAIYIKPDVIIVNYLLSEQHHDLVKTLRFEKGLENVLFFFFQWSSDAEKNAT